MKGDSTRKQPFWTPAKAGIVIGFTVLISYYFYEPMGMCVGCFIGNNIAWVENAIYKTQVVLPGIPTALRMPIIGMFIGALIAALLSGEFWIRKMRSRVVAVSFFAGGLVGFGNFLASGCPVRHMIVGTPGLALESIVTAVSIVLGIYIGAQIIKHTSWFEGG